MKSVISPIEEPASSLAPEEPEPTMLTGISVVIFGVLMQMLVIGTYLYSFTFWVEPWSTEFEAATTTVMILPTIYLYANSIGLLFFGKYLDKFPHRISVGIGLSAFSLSMFLISASSSLESIYLIYLFIVPFAVSFCGPVPAITLVSQVFHRRRGLAIGLVALGTSLGGMVVPHLVVYGMSEVGWRGTNQAFGIIALVVVVIAFPLLRHVPNKVVTETVSAPVSKVPTRTFLRQKDFWFCIAASSGAYFVFMAMQFNMAPIASEMGLATAEIAFTITLFTGGMVTGKILSGIMSEFIDPRYTYVLIGTLMIGSLGVLALQPAEIFILIGFYFFGVGAGSILPLKGLVFGQIFGTANLGRVLGLAAPFGAIYSLGPVTASYFHSIFGNYNSVFFVLMAFLFITVPLILLVRKLPAKEQGRNTV